MHKKILFFVAAAVIGISAGCFHAEKKQNVSEKTESLSIYGTWSIADLPSISGKNIQPAPAAYITFQEGKINGCSGDNRFFGNLTVKENRLQLTHMGMTRMMGPNAEYESCFMNALNEVSFFAVKGDKLYLLNRDNKIVMELAPSKTE